MAYIFETYESQLAKDRQRTYAPSNTPAAPSAEARPVIPSTRTPRQGGTTTETPPPAPPPAPPAPPPPAPAPSYTSTAGPGPSSGTPTINITPGPPPPEDNGPTNIFKRIRTGLRNVPSALQEAANKFTGEAGAYRTFQGIGGEGTINSALRPAAGTAANLEPARALLKAKYEGPEGLDDETYAPQLAALQEQISDLRQRGEGLRTAAGVEVGLRDETAGLTPGELAFEARHLRGDEGFRGQVREARQGVGRLESALGRAVEESRAIAAQRKAQEEDIAAQAKAELEAEEGAITGDLDTRVAQEEERNRQIQEGYDAWNETGDISKLAELQAAGILTTDAEGKKVEELMTPTRALAEEAARVRQGILDKYKDIEDVPPLELQITKRGHEAIGWPQEWYDQAKLLYSPEEIERMRARAMDRDNELENAGFSGRYGATHTVVGGPGAQGAQESKYGLVAPMYFGEDLELPGGAGTAGLGNYVHFDIGDSPARNNLATDDQRKIYNRIQDLLETGDSIGEAEPYKAASIYAEVERYLDEEKAALKEQRASLTKNQLEWAKTVNKAHKYFKKQQKKKKWSKVAKILSGIGTVTDIGGVKQGSNIEGDLVYHVANG